MGEEFVSCSKKCKKVTKFAYMLRQKNEQEILRAFESMLRKKAIKKQQYGAPGNQGIGSANLKSELQSANRSSLLNPQALMQYEKLGNRSTINQSLESALHQAKNNNHFYSANRYGGVGNDELEEELKLGEKPATSRFGLKISNYIPDMHEFSWDPDNSSKEIAFSSDSRHAFLFETNYLFRTMISNRPFMDG